MPVRSRRLPRARRHILYFQRLLRAQSCFALSVTVDASAMVEHRARARGRPVSHVSYLVHAVTEVLAPEADLNGVPSPGLLPNLATDGHVRPKVVVDGEHEGTRVIYSAVLPPTDGMTLDAVDREVRALGRAAPDRAPWSARARRVDSLPPLVGWPAFALAAGRSRRRVDLVGTVSVSSLGQHELTSFIASGGTPATVNAGRVVPRVFAVDGRPEVRPGWDVTMVFDHRILDGSRGGELLHGLKRRLEAGGWR